MNNHKTIAAVLSGVLMVGCSRSPPAPSPSPPSSIVTPKFNPHDFTFQNATVLETFHALDTAARRRAAEDGDVWHTQPYRTLARATQPHYLAIWSTRVDPDGMPRTSSQGDELRSVSITAMATASTPQRIRAVRLSANWLPSDDGWGAHLGFYADSSAPGQGSSRFSLQFSRIQRNTRPRRHEIELYFPLRMYDARKRYKQLEYHVRVERPAVPDDFHEEQLKRFLQSPASLRSTALASIQELEESVERAIAADEAVAWITDYSQVRSDNPPRPVPVRGQTLDPRQKRDFVDQAGAEFTRQKQLIEEHYEALHAASVRAFPLLSSLGLQDEPESVLDPDP